MVTMPTVHSIILALLFCAPKSKFESRSDKLGIFIEAKPEGGVNETLGGNLVPSSSSCKAEGICLLGGVPRNLSGIKFTK